MGTISKTVQYGTERFRQKLMKLDELTQPGWGAAAHYFHENDRMYKTTEWKVPAVIEPQTVDEAASSSPPTFGEPMETLDSVPRRFANAARDFLTREWSYEARFAETALAQTHSIPPALPNALFVSDSGIKASRSRKLGSLYIASQAYYNIETGFRRRHGDGSCVTAGMNRPIGIGDNVSIWNVRSVPISLHVSFYFISVTKLWDMIIRLCMSKGQIGHANVLDFESHWLTTNERDIVLPVTGKSDNQT